MTDNMQRAREMLAAEYEKHGRPFTARTILSNPERVGEDFNRALRAIAAALRSAQVPEGWVLVPREPTAELMAAASIAVWPMASAADVEMAKRAADIVLRESMDLQPGATRDMLAASIATMAPAYRAMLAAAPTVSAEGEG